MSVPTANETRKRAVQVLLVDGQQPIKIVVAPARLGDDHGFPDSVLRTFPDGIPLDLDPSWPLQLDLDGDDDAMFADLSFQGSICRCRIPWAAIMLLGAGLSGLPWRFDEAADAAGRKRGHLRLVD